MINKYQQSSFVIITGAPSTGKTTLINALKEAKIPVVHEAAREEIIYQKSVGGNSFPWENIDKFSERVLKRITNLQYQTGTYFCDRGIPDIMAYLKMAGLPIKKEYYDALSKINYHKKVFLAPIWNDIYVNDSERKENIEEAQKLEKHLVETYLELDFEIYKIPFTTVKKRKTWLLEKCGNVI